jgi:HSP20 family protein
MTTLVRWNPPRELELMERRMRRMFEGFAPFFPIEPMLPAADIYETKDELVVELEVPGYEEKELAIEVTNHLLTVKGEHEVTKEEEEKTFRLHERLERVFERRFELPAEVDTEKLTAIFKQGVLEVHVPRVKPMLPKKIPIKTP